MSAAVNCERCQATDARVCAIDEPENDGGLMFGDQLLGVLLCSACLALTEADGPWSRVEVLDAAVTHQAAA